MVITMLLRRWGFGIDNRERRSASADQSFRVISPADLPSGDIVTIYEPRQRAHDSKEGHECSRVPRLDMSQKVCLRDVIAFKYIILKSAAVILVATVLESASRILIVKATADEFPAVVTSPIRVGQTSSDHLRKGCVNRDVFVLIFIGEIGF